MNKAAHNATFATPPRPVTSLQSWYTLRIGSMSVVSAVPPDSMNSPFASVYPWASKSSGSGPERRLRTSCYCGHAKKEQLTEWLAKSSSFSRALRISLVKQSYICDPKHTKHSRHIREFIAPASVGTNLKYSSSGLSWLQRNTLESNEIRKAALDWIKWPKEIHWVPSSKPWTWRYRTQKSGILRRTFEQLCFIVNY